MAQKDSRLVIVSEDVLPEIINKVLTAKRLRASGEAANSAEACREAGISRSAYYKYKDKVWSYNEQISNRIVSVYMLLRDEKGVLSSIISRLYELGANILTINQNIPIDSVATVTVSVRYDAEGETERLQSELKGIRGVVDVKLIAGE
ncbi:MAG: ACT domain-containing protein [Ruminococcus sp.]|nr:ACT domain-containing protein [Ruminococcus sp.]